MEKEKASVRLKSLWLSKKQKARRMWFIKISQKVEAKPLTNQNNAVLLKKGVPAQL